MQCNRSSDTNNVILLFNWQINHLVDLLGSVGRLQGFNKPLGHQQQEASHALQWLAAMDLRLGDDWLMLCCTEYRHKTKTELVLTEKHKHNLELWAFILGIFTVLASHFTSFHNVWNAWCVNVCDNMRWCKWTDFTLFESSDQKHTWAHRCLCNWIWLCSLRSVECCSDPRSVRSASDAPDPDLREMMSIIHTYDKLKWQTLRLQSTKT